MKPQIIVSHTSLTPSIHSHCISELHQVNNFEIYHTSKECCDENFPSSSACLQEKNHMTLFHGLSISLALSPGPGHSRCMSQKITGELLIGFLTWSINWIVSGEVTMRTGWWWTVLKLTICLTMPKIVVKNGENNMRYRFVLLVLISLFSLSSLFDNLQFFIQVFCMLRLSWWPACCESWSRRRTMAQRSIFQG